MANNQLYGTDIEFVKDTNVLKMSQLISISLAYIDFFKKKKTEGVAHRFDLFVTLVSLLGTHLLSVWEMCS